MEYLTSQFADDTSIYLDGSRESFENVIKVLTEFALWSCLKINYDKSQVVWLGSQKGSATVFLPHLKLKWNPTRFSVLGNRPRKNYGSELKSQDRTNTNSFEKLAGEKLLNSEKITVIKSLMLSRITHPFLSLPNRCNRFIKDLTLLFYKFIWNGKRDKIKRTTLCKSLEEGGNKIET